MIENIRRALDIASYFVENGEDKSAISIVLTSEDQKALINQVNELVSSGTSWSDASAFNGHKIIALRNIFNPSMNDLPFIKSSNSFAIVHGETKYRRGVNKNYNTLYQSTPTFIIPICKGVELRDAIRVDGLLFVIS